jgi:hypothetical protein
MNTIYTTHYEQLAKVLAAKQERQDNGQPIVVVIPKSVKTVKPPIKDIRQDTGSC